IKFLWLGEGETKGALIDQIIMNRDENIFHENFNSNPFSLINYSKPILFSASKGEGLPLTLIEGASLGIPIIASNVTGNNEVVIDSFNGFLFENNSIEDAKQKILELINNDKLYEIFSN